MNKADLNRRFGFLLHDISRLMKRRFDRRAEQVGLTRAQWSVVAHLYRQEGVNQATLADWLDIKQITLARLADRLEAAGWLERRPHPGDRRAKCVYLTDKAHAQVEQMRTLADEVQEEALHGVSPEHRALLIDLLLQVKDNLISAQNGERPAPQAAPLPLK
ncbi:MAG TPA: MarR family transcriptional regulator [bacterium]|nr:MarR family transcriptional regulator [bacterium]